jgi:hypothetical protein
MLWSIGQFPELDHLDPRERTRLLRRVPWWTYPMIVLLSVIVGALAGVVTAFIVADSWGRPAGAATFAVMAAVVAALIYYRLLCRLRFEMRKEIAAGFLGRRPPFCLACGYDLRASCEDRCPECGGALAPEIIGAATRNVRSP